MGGVNPIKNSLGLLIFFIFIKPLRRESKIKKISLQ